MAQSLPQHLTQEQLEDQDKISKIANYRSETPGNGMRLFRLIFNRDSALNIQYRALAVIMRSEALTIEQIAERSGLTLVQAQKAVLDLHNRGAINFCGINGEAGWTAPGLITTVRTVFMGHYVRKARRRLFRWFLVNLAIASIVSAIALLAYSVWQIFADR